MTTRFDAFARCSRLAVALAMLALASAHVTAQQDTVTVRVFVFTQPAPGGFVDTMFTRRTQATTEAITEIRKKYRKTISLVEAKDQADVIVEILDVPEADGEVSNKPNLIVPGSRSVKTIEFQVRAQLSAGSYATAITTQDKKLATAARLVASDLDKWVQANRDRVLATRTATK